MGARRMHQKDTVHFVTNRCEHEMFLLLPNETITNIIQCWFARAVCLYGDGLEIYAFIFLSNHFLCAAAHKKWLEKKIRTARCRPHTP